MVPMRTQKLLVTGLIVLTAGAMTMAGPQDPRQAAGGAASVMETWGGKKICGFPRPAGVPQEIWENACESCTSVPVSPEASADGTLTSHSCDGGYEVRIHVVPGAKYPAGAKRDVMKGGGLG